MATKLTKAQRVKLRILRKQWQNVFKRIREKNFQYVIQREAPRKICFGAGVERECLPFKGPAKSSLMKRFIPDNLIGPGPTAYDIKSTLLRKFPNVSGYGGLAYIKPRETLTARSANPPIGTYELCTEKKLKQCPKPFNVGAKLTKKGPRLTPAPGSYKFRKRNQTVNEGFGRQRIISPAVQIICAPRNEARCCVCEEVPLGDYWRCWDYGQDMCRPCMLKEKYEATMIKPKTKKMKRLADLDKFLRVRYCGFVHEHSGTRAAVKLLSRRQLNIKFRTENYLSMFHY